MAITKQIGKNTLGQGKKTTQSLKDYGRSTHDLSSAWRSTMAPGTLVPFMVQILLAGDTMDIDLETDVMTHPTIGPAFAAYKMQLDVFKVPLRLYNAQLHNNPVKVGMNMDEMLFPVLNLTGNNIDFTETKDPALQQIGTSSLLRYLGIKNIGQVTGGTAQSMAQRNFNAIPYLAYWDIYKQYYANLQEDNGAMIHYNETPITTISIEQIVDTENNTVKDLPATVSEENMRLQILGPNITPDNITITYTPQNGVPTTLPFSEIVEEVTFVEAENMNAIDGKIRQSLYGAIISSANVPFAGIGVPEPEVTFFPLSNIDDMRQTILSSGPAQVQINANSPLPYGGPLQNTLEDRNSVTKSYLDLEGLGIKTYQSDIYNNWINTEFITGENGVAAASNIDVSGGLLSMDTLNLAQKVYNLLNRISISGGSYYDWIEVVYGINGYRNCETPVYEGGMSREIIFTELNSTAATTDKPLGTLAGKGRQGDKKGGKITVHTDEPCYVIGIVSITPRIDYSQGNRWDVNLMNFNELHKPEYDGIAYQDLLTDQMAGWDTLLNTDGTISYRSAGKTVAWINYTTDVNECYGNFADPDNEMFMTLNRRYEVNTDNNANTIKDLTTYIDPAKYNYIFAETDRTAQNFWIQIGKGITARRVMSAHQIPNL